MSLDALETARLKLMCNCCGKRGACVQCAGGRCLTAYHPWCLTHAPVGKVHRALRKGNELQVSLFGLNLSFRAVLDLSLAR